MLNRLDIRRRVVGLNTYFWFGNQRVGIIFQSRSGETSFELSLIMNCCWQTYVSLESLFKTQKFWEKKLLMKMMMMWQKQACGFCPEGGAGDACAACGAGLCFERLGCRCRNRVVQEVEVPMSTNRFQRACQGEQRAGETPRVVEPSSPVQRQCSTLIREGPPQKMV